MQNSLSLQQLLGLISFSVTLAVGQMLFKKTAESATNLNSFQSIFSLLWIPSFWLAGILYIASTLLWIKLLQTVPISRAYPFSALGFVLVPMAAYFLFKEIITIQYALGASLIVLGIIIVARS